MKRKRQKAPPPPKPTRRVSDATLMRVLDEHMLESLSDIAAMYQRLASSLGYGTMKWKEYIKVQSSLTNNDRWLDSAGVIASWRVACGKHRLNVNTVVMVVTEAAGLSAIMKKLKLTRNSVVRHLRACLAVWSLKRKRINTEELIRLLREVASDRQTQK